MEALESGRGRLLRQLRSSTLLFNKMAELTLSVRLLISELQMELNLLYGFSLGLILLSLVILTAIFLGRISIRLVFVSHTFAFLARRELDREKDPMW